MSDNFDFDQAPAALQSGQSLKRLWGVAPQSFKKTYSKNT